MNAFIVELENRAGEMARVTEVLAKREVNILVSGLGLNGRGAIAFVANDEERARSALREAEIAYREVPVVHVRMEDRPGQAARTSRRLADAGVNIQVWLPVDTTLANFTVAIGVDKVEAARRALSDQLTMWSYH